MIHVVVFLGCNICFVDILTGLVISHIQSGRFLSPGLLVSTSQGTQNKNGVYRIWSMISSTVGPLLFTSSSFQSRNTCCLFLPPSDRSGLLKNEWLGDRSFDGLCLKVGVESFSFTTPIWRWEKSDMVPLVEWVFIPQSLWLTSVGTWESQSLQDTSDYCSTGRGTVNPMIVVYRLFMGFKGKVGSSFFIGIKDPQFSLVYLLDLKVGWTVIVPS